MSLLNRIRSLSFGALGLSLAFLIGGVLPADAEAGASTLTLARSDYQRIGLGTASTGSATTSIDVNGVPTSAVVTVTRSSTLRLDFVFDFGSGNSLSAGADLTLVGTNLYSIGDVTTVAGTGTFQGLTLGTMTFHTGGGSDFTTDSPAGDGPSVVEFVLTGTLCEPPPPPPRVDLCDAGKPATLTLRYTGEDCSASSHSQAADKTPCSGDPNFEANVRILVTDKKTPGDSKATVWFDGTVALGATFVANAGSTDRIGTNTFVYVYDLSGNLLQSVAFHTSCSQPLFTGDQFGSIVLVDFTVANGNGLGKGQKDDKQSKGKKDDKQGKGKK